MWFLLVPVVAVIRNDAPVEMCESKHVQPGVGDGNYTLTLLDSCRSQDSLTQRTLSGLPFPVPIEVVI